MTRREFLKEVKWWIRDIIDDAEWAVSNNPTSASVIGVGMLILLMFAITMC